jgi:hypothetical protein
MYLCANVSMDSTFRAKFHHPFHELWGEVVGLPNYNKRHWQELDTRLRSAWSMRNEKRAEMVLREARYLHAQQGGTTKQ